MQVVDALGCRIVPNACAYLSFLEAAGDVRPEFLPQVAAHAGDDAHAAAYRGLRSRRLARRQPAVLDQVVQRVSCVAAPGWCESAVAALRQHRGLERVARPRPDAFAAGSDIAWIFAPQGAESCFDRVRDRDVGFAVRVTFRD